ncbi:MAG: CHAT domain-containing protein [Saprospiraceae bacterium]
MPIHFRSFFLLLFLLLQVTLNAQEISVDSLQLKKGQAYYSSAEQVYGSNLDSCLHFLKMAFPCFEKAHAWGDYIRTLNVIAAISNDLNYIEEFENYAKKAYQKASVHLPEDHPEYSVTRNNLNIFYYNRGNYEKSISLLKASLLLSQSNQKSEEDISYIYQNLGANYNLLGDQQKALSYLEKALSIQTKLEKYPVAIARLHKEIGLVHLALQQHAKAIYFFNQARSMLNKKSTDRTNIIKIAALQGLSESYLLQEKLDSAKHYITKSLQLQKDDDAYRKAFSYELLGRVHAKEKRNPLAIKALLTANELAKLNFKNNSYAGVAKKKRYLGETYFAMAELDKALTAYQEGLDILSPGVDLQNKLTNPSTTELLAAPDALLLLYGKTKILWQLFEKEKEVHFLHAALATSQKTHELIQKVRAEIPSADAKHNLAEKTIAFYENAIQISLKLQELTSDNSFLEIAFSFAESNKALSLMETLNEQIAERLELPDSLLVKEKTTRIDLVYYQKKILEAQGEGVETDQAKIADWKAQVFTLKQQHEQLVDQFEKEFPRYYEIKYQKNTVNYQDLKQGLLKNNHAFLEYFVGENKIYLFVLTKENITVQTIDKLDSIQSDIKGLRDFTTSPPTVGVSPDRYAQFVKQAHHLYEILLKPALETMAPKYDKITIIPDGDLAFIPFDLLLTNLPAQTVFGFKPQQLDYLLNKYQISYGYSIALLNKNLNRDAQKFEADFVGFAPSFPELTSSLSRACGNGELYNLTCNQSELNAINQQLQGQGFAATEANKMNFNQQASKFKILHLATHACVDEAHPMNSKIYLTDDYLSLLDLYTLDLQSELVVLSACNTGSGKLLKGEGVMSLARGFIASGCRSTLMSMWSVDDCATSDIMTVFYKNLAKGLAKDEALRQSKLAYLASVDKTMQHPYYWAAFAQFGATKPIEFESQNTWKYLLGTLLILLIFLGRKFLFKTTSNSD